MGAKYLSSTAFVAYPPRLASSPRDRQSYGASSVDVSSLAPRTSLPSYLRQVTSSAPAVVSKTAILIPHSRNTDVTKCIQTKRISVDGPSLIDTCVQSSLPGFSTQAR